MLLLLLLLLLLPRLLQWDFNDGWQPTATMQYRHLLDLNVDQRQGPYHLTVFK